MSSPLKLEYADWLKARDTVAEKIAATIVDLGFAQDASTVTLIASDLLSAGLIDVVGILGEPEVEVAPLPTWKPTHVWQRTSLAQPENVKILDRAGLVEPDAIWIERADGSTIVTKISRLTRKGGLS